MPDSSTDTTVFPSAARAPSRTVSDLFSPTRFHEDPEMFVDDRLADGRVGPTPRARFEIRGPFRLEGESPSPEYGLVVGQIRQPEPVYCPTGVFKILPNRTPAR
jgi:hypothetical protein